MNTEVFLQDNDGNVYVSIPLEEYKELLITKGKYEELKSQQNIAPWTVKPTPLGRTNITYSSPRWEPKERKVIANCDTK